MRLFFYTGTVGSRMGEGSDLHMTGGAGGMERGGAAGRQTAQGGRLGHLLLDARAHLAAVGRLPGQKRRQGVVLGQLHPLGAQAAAQLLQDPAGNTGPAALVGRLEADDAVDAAEQLG